MKSQGRIPMKLETFIVYIVLVNEYLHSTLPGHTLKRGLELGMTSDNLDDLDKWVKKFISGDPTSPGYWDLHKNKQKKTATTRSNMVDAMALFAAFFRPILNRMSGAEEITNDDRDILNIAHPVTSHTKPSTSIKSQCMMAFTMMGQGKLRIECRASADEARASKPEGADAVEMAYSSRPIITVEPTKDNELSSKVKPKQLAGPDEAAEHKTFTKAIFEMQFTDDEVGNDLQMFGRWINTKHPELNGPWSSMYELVIS